MGRLRGSISSILSSSFLLSSLSFFLSLLITFIELNYCSLVSSIAFYRPDLLTSSSPPISLNPPSGFFPAVEIPGVGELMLSSFPNEAEFLSSISPNNWWMGEKYDGIRYCLNSDQRIVYTRKGNAMTLHSPIHSSLPSCFSDGEIWFGRNEYGYSSALVLKVGLKHIPWNLFRMVPFDSPAISLQNKPFEKRYEHLLQSILFNHPFTIVATRVLCKGSGHLKSFISSILKDKGEGSILRRIRSIYEFGRSSCLVKLKSSQIDTEALVAKVENKVITLQLPGGRQVVVDSPVQVSKGDIVTVSFPLLSHRASSPLLISPSSSTLPSLPLIVTRVRNDVSWEDVRANAAKDKLNGIKQVEDFIIDWESRNIVDTHKTINADWKEIKNRRQFFEGYASNNGFDPLIPDNWYTRGMTVKYLKDFHSVVWYHKKSMSQALVDLFPEIGIERNKFFNWPLKYKQERRKFFEEFAFEHQFNSLIPSNWYQVSPLSLFGRKDVESVLAYHDGQVSKALTELFPEVNFDTFTLLSTFDLTTVEKRREVFEQYARDNNFDPLVATNWYSQSRQRMLKSKGIKTMIEYHGRSISKALQGLFPDIGIDRSKFQFVQRFWHKRENRRNYFLKYAKTNNFDPYKPENWYSLSIPSLMSSKEVRSIISYHESNLPKTLVDLFPDIGLDASKFENRKKLFGDYGNRKAFFEEYAKENGFDPLVPRNWYSQPSENIWAKKGAQRVLFYHDRSISMALMDLFPNIGFVKSQFKDLSSRPDTGTMRQFFEKYAKRNGFNHLIPENWYSQSKKKILNASDGLMIMSYFKLNVPQALVTLFPEIGLEINKFKLAK